MSNETSAPEAGAGTVEGRPGIGERALRSISHHAPGHGDLLLSGEAQQVLAEIAALRAKLEQAEADHADLLALLRDTQQERDAARRELAQVRAYLTNANAACSKQAQWFGLLDCKSCDRLTRDLQMEILFRCIRRVLVASGRAVPSLGDMPPLDPSELPVALDGMLRMHEEISKELEDAIPPVAHEYGAWETLFAKAETADALQTSAEAVLREFGIIPVPGSAFTLQTYAGGQHAALQSLNSAFTAAQSVSIQPPKSEAPAQATPAPAPSPTAQHLRDLRSALAERGLACVVGADGRHRNAGGEYGDAAACAMCSPLEPSPEERRPAAVEWIKDEFSASEWDAHPAEGLHLSAWRIARLLPNIWIHLTMPLDTTPEQWKAEAERIAHAAGLLPVEGK